LPTRTCRRRSSTTPTTARGRQLSLSLALATVAVLVLVVLVLVVLTVLIFFVLLIFFLTVVLILLVVLGADLLFLCVRKLIVVALFGALRGCLRPGRAVHLSHAVVPVLGVFLIPSLLRVELHWWWCFNRRDRSGARLLGVLSWREAIWVALRILPTQPLPLELRLDHLLRGRDHLVRRHPARALGLRGRHSDHHATPDPLTTADRTNNPSEKRKTRQ
jgi:hypothetical protein